MNRKNFILSTNIIPDLNQKLHNVNLVSHNFIQIIPINFQSDEISNGYENWIISSQNAVDVLFNTFQTEKLTQINFFCVGSKTAEKLVDAGYHVISFKSYGEELCHEIKEKYANLKFLFICGENRTDIIPSHLSKFAIEFKEIHIYKTDLTSTKINEKLDGIMFYSPSGIQSYVQSNTIEKEVLFCIGKTTAKEAEKYSQNIIISKNQTIDSLIESVKNYYA